MSSYQKMGTLNSESKFLFEAINGEKGLYDMNAFKEQLSPNLTLRDIKTGDVFKVLKRTLLSIYKIDIFTDINFGTSYLLYNNTGSNIPKINTLGELSNRTLFNTPSINAYCDDSYIYIKINGSPVNGNYLRISLVLDFFHNHKGYESSKINDFQEESYTKVLTREDVGTKDKRPKDSYKATPFYDETLNKYIFSSGYNWVDAYGNPADSKTYGDSTNRPNGINIGFQYFDTTLNKPIWWNGSSWVDANGTSV